MKKVTGETIVRTVVLIFALINQVLTMFGLNPMPFSDAEVYEGCTALLTVAASLWAWWKNVSFTKEAIEADKIKNAMKNGEISVDDVDQLLNKDP